MAQYFFRCFRTFFARPGPKGRLWPHLLFVWQVQQFRCLWDVLPWPYTCLLGRVASDWQWLCVAGAIVSMPPRSTLWPKVWRHWWPYLLFVWKVQNSRWLREVPCVYVLLVWQVQIIGDNGDPTFFLCGRCNIFRCFRTFFVIPPPFCVAGANHWRQWWPYFLFVWQVQYFRCLGEVSRDPISILCGRCTSNPSSEKYFVTTRSFCVAGAICSMPPRSSRDLDPGVACDPTSFVCVAGAIFFDASEKFCWYCQRLVVTLRPFCVGCAIISLPSDPTALEESQVTDSLPPRRSPGRLWVGSQATTTPHNSSDHVILRICFLRRHLIIFAWHGLCPASKV